MTVIQLKNYVWSLVDDLAGAYFTSAELTRFINQQQQEVQKLLVLAGNNWYLKVDQTASTVVNQFEYSLPADFMKLNRVELVQNPGPNETTFPLTSITLNQKSAFLNFSGMPQAFYFQKDKLIMVPAPQSVWTIRYTYTYRIADIANDNDIPDIPAEFQEFLAKLVILQCFIKDGRDASLLVSEVNEVKKRLEADAIERAQDRASTVVTMGDDALGVYY